MKAIIERWRELDWLPPFPNLDRHLEHVLGGCAVVFILISFGVEWSIAACITSGVFFIIEFTTALFIGNWKDSTFDFVQYQFHWPFYLAHIGNWYLFGVIVVALLWLYVKLLLARW